MRLFSVVFPVYIVHRNIREHIMAVKIASASNFIKGLLKIVEDILDIFKSD